MYSVYYHLVGSWFLFAFALFILHYWTCFKPISYTLLHDFCELNKANKWRDDKMVRFAISPFRHLFICLTVLTRKNAGIGHLSKHSKLMLPLVVIKYLAVTLSVNILWLSPSGATTFSSDRHHMIYWSSSAASDYRTWRISPTVFIISALTHWGHVQSQLRPVTAAVMNESDYRFHTILY